MFIAPISKDYRSSFRSEILIDKLKCVFVFKWNLVFAMVFSHSAPKGACLVESVVEVYKHFTPSGVKRVNPVWVDLATHKSGNKLPHSK